MMPKLFLLFAVAVSAVALVASAATVDSEKINPNLPGTDPGTGNIAQYVVNAYRFALLIGGLLAFGVIVFGAVKYAASGGNSSMQSDAKAWITDAILGLILLAGATLLLTFINPDLANLKAQPPLTRLSKPDAFSLAIGGGASSTTYGCETVAGYIGCASNPNCIGLVCANPATCAKVDRASCNRPPGAGTSTPPMSAPPIDIKR